MSKQLLMYEKVVPLNKMVHKDLSLKVLKDLGFAKELNSVPLTTAEFPSASSEYAIVFAGGDEIMPAVIMGLEQKENLYVGEKGWKSNYVPAFVRRYPFVFSSSKDDDKLVLCIDETFAGFNRDGKGERLFDNDGEQTHYLKSILAFMENYQAHFRQTQLFCAKLKELDLLEPMTARATIKGKGERTITGFYGVDRNKLKTMPADNLKELMRGDWLELIYIHLHSVRNFGLMIDRIISKEDTAKSEVESELDSEMDIGEDTSDTEVYLADLEQEAFSEH